MCAFILLKYVFQLMIRYIPYLNCRMDETASHAGSLLINLDHIYIKLFFKVKISLLLLEKL